MQSPLLSIIVPVYNVEAYIEKCLLSLQAQSYSNIEIICVDDASPDNSAALITKMSENDKRIHLIRHEENQGLFHARLSGLKIAQGEFVAFADSDDYVSCDWFRPLIKTAMEDNADMVLGNTINVSEDGTRTYYNHYRSFNRNKKPLTKDRLLSSFFSQQGECFIWHTVWNKVYRKSLFDRALPFLEKMKPPLVMGEDIAFSSVLYALADKLSFCDNDCYFYYRHSDASTGLAHSSDRFKKYVRDICKVFAFVQDFLTSNDYPTAVIGDFMRFKEKYFRIWSGNIRAAGFENDKEIVKCLLNGFEKKSLASVNDGEFYFYEQSTEWDEKFEELRYKISQPEVKIVSFDIFDTLITRPFWEAQDLFYFVAERIGFSNPLTFVSMRKEAEAVCRKAAKMLDSSVEDVTLADIYSFMGKLFGFPPKKAERMQKAEEEAELFFCRSRQAGKVLYDLALFLGKKVILTSDMYLEENVVRQILDENGYRDHAKLYLSSAHKRLKTTGRLFRLMLKEEDVAPENVLHIGDNWQADIVSAQKMRIPTLFFPKATETFSNNISNIYTGDSFKEIYCGIHKNIDSRGLLQQLPLRCMFAVAAYGGFDDPFRSFNRRSYYDADPYYMGFCALGMHLFGLAKWLYDKLTENGQDRIVFLARDGFLIKQAFDLLFADRGIKTSYFHANRKLLLPYAVRSSEDLYNAFQYIDLSSNTPADILALFAPVCKELTLARITEYQKRGIRMDEPVKTVGSYLHLAEAIVSISYCGAEKEREEIGKCFAQIFRGNCACFDIGYSGRLQKIINDLAGKKMDAYYIHDNGSEALTCARKNGFKIHSFYGFTPQITSILREYLISDPSAAAVSMKVCKGQLIFEKERVKSNYAEEYAVREMQRGALDFCVYLRERLGDFCHSFEFRGQDISLAFENFLLNASDFDRRAFRNSFIEDKVYGGYDRKNFYEIWNWHLSRFEEKQGFPAEPEYRPADSVYGKEEEKYMFLAEQPKIKKAMFYWLFDRKKFHEKLKEHKANRKRLKEDKK